MQCSEFTSLDALRGAIIAVVFQVDIFPILGHHLHIALKSYRVDGEVDVERIAWNRGGTPTRLISEPGKGESRRRWRWELTGSIPIVLQSKPGRCVEKQLRTGRLGSQR